MFSLNSVTNLEMAAGSSIIDPYLSSIYLYNRYDHESGIGLEEGEYRNILIQITQVSDGTIIIDPRSSNYLYLKSPHPQLSNKNKNGKILLNPIFSQFLKEIYDIEFPLDKLNIYNLASPSNDYLFNYFINNANPIVSLPVRLDVTRYFVKYDDKLDDDDIEEIKNNSSILAENDSTTETNNSSEQEDLEKAPQSLICKVCDIRASQCTFIDPLLGVEYDILPYFESITWIEKTKDQYDLIINRLEPQVDTTSKTLADFFSFRQLVPSLLAGTLNFKTDNIINIIESTFGRQISFTGFDNDVKKIVIANSDKEKANPIISVIDLIESDAEFKQFFRVINFLRSYVDLYHDILEFGKDYCKSLRENFEKTVPPVHKTFYDKYIDLITKDPKTKIFTKAEKINQNRCKEIVEKLTDEWISFLHQKEAKFIPKTKENANVISASLENPTELANLFKIILSDGINGFYIESANNNIGEIFTKQKFPLFNLSIGEWDAGSGFTGKKMKVAERPIPIEIGPKTFLNSQKINASKSIYLDNLPASMFGLINANVTSNNNTLNVSPDGVNNISVTPRQKLSVNKVLKTTDNIIIRGLGDIEEAGIIKTVPQITPTSSLECRTALISLKTWTDLIQIETISKTMTIKKANSSPLKILTVIYDGLCETTARMYGLGHVLKTEGKIVTYYNYNIGSRSLSKDQLLAKSQIRKFIFDYRPYFERYVNMWFEQRILCLQTIYDIFPDPILYFVSTLFKDKYYLAQKKAIELIQNISTTDIKVIPDTLNDYLESISSSATLLAELLDYVAKFRDALNRINEVGVRGNLEKYLGAYDYVQQLIVNTFGDSDAIKLRAMVASTFAYVFLKNTKLSVCLSKLEVVKDEIVLNQLIRSGFMSRSQANQSFIVPIQYTRSINQSAFNNAKLKASYSKIKELPESEAKKRLQSITDIEIACQYLLLNTPTYSNFIKTISLGRVSLEPQFAFSNIIDQVTSVLNTSISSFGYFGGKSHKSVRKTIRHKSKKHKTYKKRK